MSDFRCRGHKTNIPRYLKLEPATENDTISDCPYLNVNDNRCASYIVGDEYGMSGSFAS